MTAYPSLDSDLRKTHLKFFSKLKFETHPQLESLKINVKNCNCQSLKGRIIKYKDAKLAIYRDVFINTGCTFFTVDNERIYELRTNDEVLGHLTAEDVDDFIKNKYKL